MPGDDRNGLSAGTVAWDAWRAVRGGPKAIAERQAARLDAVVRHARRWSRYYAEHYRGLPSRAQGSELLDMLAPVGKPELMARFDDWVTDPAVTRAGVEAFVAEPGNVGQDFLGRYVVFTTSGSTGVPALLVQDQRSVAVMTGVTYGRALHGVSPRLLARMMTRVPRQAAVFATGGHFVSTAMFARRLRQRPFRRRIARFFSVLDPMPTLVGQLNDFRPALVGTYPSALAALTVEQLAGRLHISPIAITSGGELLTPEVRRRAEAAFGCPVTQSYSTSEAVPLALPCRYDRLHVNSDWFIVEPVTAEGQPVPSGSRSDGLLVTNLANFVQPVIRYQLGDRVVVSDSPCACGSPLSTISVEGRTDDALRLAGARGGEVVVLPMAVATVIEQTPGVYRYQVLQTAPEELTVRLEPDPGVDRSVVWQRLDAVLRTLLIEHGVEDVTLRLAPEAPQPDPRSGKLRHVLGRVRVGPVAAPGQPDRTEAWAASSTAEAPRQP